MLALIRIRQVSNKHYITSPSGVIVAPSSFLHLLDIIILIESWKFDLLIPPCPKESSGKLSAIITPEGK
jgi:hypothetical protein